MREEQNLKLKRIYSGLLRTALFGVLLFLVSARVKGAEPLVLVIDPGHGGVNL